MTDSMPSEWEVKKLEDVIRNIRSGATPSRSNTDYWENGDVPWVKISDISEKYVTNTEEKMTGLGLEETSAKIFSPGTILVTIFATVGKVGILDIEAATNQAIVALSADENIVTNEYLYYYLRSRKDYLQSKGRGGAQDNINQGTLKQTPVIIPPIEEQNRIVEYLDMAFEYKKQLVDYHNKLEDLIEILPMSILTDTFPHHMAEYHELTDTLSDEQSNVDRFVDQQ